MTLPSGPDTIFLRGLEVECLIGFIEWERRIRQKVVIDFVSTSEFKLVETLSHRVAMLVLEEFDVAWIRLSVNKPGAIRGSRDVGVSIERTRADLAAAKAG